MHIMSVIHIYYNLLKWRMKKGNNESNSSKNVFSCIFTVYSLFARNCSFKPVFICHRLKVALC